MLRSYRINYSRYINENLIYEESNYTTYRIINTNSQVDKLTLIDIARD